MNTETTKLTIRLPKRRVDFAKRYAREHGVSVTELIDRYMRGLHAAEQGPAGDQLEAITGLVPEDVDTRAAYHQHLLDKHA